MVHPLVSYHSILIPRPYLLATRLTNLELDRLGNLLCILDATTLDLLLVMNLILIDIEEGTKIIMRAEVHDILRNILPRLKEEGAKLSVFHLQAAVMMIIGMIKGKVRI